MSSRLEKYIRDHRESFDSDAPPKRIWDQIQQQAQTGEKEVRPMIWLSPGRWGVAVALSLLVAGGTWALTQMFPGNRHPIVAPAVIAPAGNRSSAATPPVKNTPGVTPADTVDTGKNSIAQATSTNDPAPDHYQEEMGYYAHLVRVKHRELKGIEKDEPLLYEQFSGDVKKLDSVYHELESQLSENHNREQLLEAMLQNLQLQRRLLNHQLGIIKQINHSKKTAYEKAYKTT